MHELWLPDALALRLRALEAIDRKRLRDLQQACKWSNKGERMQPRTALRAGVIATTLSTALALLMTVPAHAYDASDTYAAIEQASASTGIPSSWLTRVVSCETGGTFDPSSKGDHGTSFGAAQLHRGGELEKFYAAGYEDPMNPYQALQYTAEAFAAGRSTAWSCR